MRSKIRRFREEPVPRVYGICPAAAGNIKDRILVKICFVICIPGKIIRFCRLVNIRGAAVRLGVHGYCFNPHFLCRADNTQGDLGPVGNEQFFHIRLPYVPLSAFIYCAIYSYCVYCVLRRLRNAGRNIPDGYTPPGTVFKPDSQRSISRYPFRRARKCFA